MVLLILVLVLVVWGVAATVIEVRRDGYRQTPTDWSRVPGPDPLQRAESTTVYR